MVEANLQQLQHLHHLISWTQFHSHFCLQDCDYDAIQSVGLMVIVTADRNVMIALAQARSDRSASA